MRSVLTLTNKFFLFLRKVLFSILKSSFCNLENYSLLRKKEILVLLRKEIFVLLRNELFFTEDLKRGFKKVFYLSKKKKKKIGFRFKKYFFLCLFKWYFII